MKKLHIVITFVLAIYFSGLSAVRAQGPTIPGTGFVTGPFVGEAEELNGAGATFPQPLYTTWFSDYAQLTGVKVNYQGIGSGGGIKSITDKTVDFGASDAPMTDDQLTAAKATCGTDLLHIPMTLGGVVITYNIPEFESRTIIKFTPETLSGIFLGTITVWNDSALVKDNPTIANINQPISVVHRSDGSGTTNIMTSYLSAINETWDKTVGHGTSVRWPTGIGQKGNAGVAGAITAVPYAMGYVELAYAQQNHLPISFIQNADGMFVQPNAVSVSQAAIGVTLPHDLRVMIINGKGVSAYPISGFTWILVCPNQTDQAKAFALVRMLWWATHDGQLYNADGQLGYSPLPEVAIRADESQIAKIMLNEQPVLPMVLPQAAKS